jgi:hypothetical protein
MISNGFPFVTDLFCYPPGLTFSSVYDGKQYFEHILKYMYLDYQNNLRVIKFEIRAALILYFNQ